LKNSGLHTHTEIIIPRTISTTNCSKEIQRVVLTEMSILFKNDFEVMYIQFVNIKATIQGTWWHMPIILATQKVEVEEFQFETIPDKVNPRPYLKNKLKTKL
jgi:hypothetical protein